MEHRVVDLGPVRLRDPDPSGVTPPPRRSPLRDPRLGHVAVAFAATLAMSVVYVLAVLGARVHDRAAPPPPATAPAQGSAAPAAVGAIACPQRPRPRDGHTGLPAQVGEVSLCRYRFPDPDLAARDATLVDGPIAGDPAVFARALAPYPADDRWAWDPATCPEASGPVTVDVVLIGHGTEVGVFPLPRVSCRDRPGVPADLAALLDAALGPVR